MFHSGRMGLWSKWDIDADLVVVGSGIGGMTAAITAHDLGLRVVVLEKAAKLGGVSAYSGGEVFVPDNHVMRRDGLADSAEAGREYFRWLGAGYADPALMDNLLAAAPEVTRMLEEKAGVRWKTIA